MSNTFGISNNNSAPGMQAGNLPSEQQETTNVFAKPSESKNEKIARLRGEIASIKEQMGELRGAQKELFDLRTQLAKAENDAKGTSSNQPIGMRTAIFSDLC